MIDQAIQSKIRKIKLHTKHIMQSTLAGDYASAFKGSGLEFNQIRDYQQGDDIRSIDWNSSAKINKIMVKQFIEERERTVILAIDISASTAYSSLENLRKDVIADLACSLAFIASGSKDNVGALFFSDMVEKWISPSKGNVHLGRIIEHIYTVKPTHTQTNIATALRFLASLKKRGAVVFIISDWIDEISRYKNLLKITGLQYDVVGIRVNDPTEIVFPNIGFIDIKDPESGITFSLDTYGVNAHNQKLSTFLRARRIEQKHLFDKYRIDMLDLNTAEPFVNQLASFFHQRTRRQSS